MGFVVFMIACDLFLPIVIGIAGWCLEKHPPEDINGFFGYRTDRSRKNQEAWDFAQKHWGKNARKVGTILFIVTFLMHIVCWNVEKDVLGTLSLIIVSVQVLALIATIFPTEKALKELLGE